MSLSGKGRTREDFDRDVTAALENAGVRALLPSAAPVPSGYLAGTSGG